MEYESYRKESERSVRRAEPEKEGQRGYVPSEKEKKEGTAPQEVTGLKTGDNHLSFGINRNREVTMVLSVDDEKGIRQDRKQVEMDKAKKVENTQGKMLTNTRSPGESAVAVKISLDKQGYGLEQKLWSTAEKLAENQVVEDVIPFVTHQQEAKDGTPEAIHQRQEQDRVRQEIRASLEKLKKQAEKTADWHRMIFADMAAFLEADEEGEEDEEGGTEALPEE